MQQAVVVETEDGQFNTLEVWIITSPHGRGMGRQQES
jgi:hypothetical protein